MNIGTNNKNKHPTKKQLKALIAFNQGKSLEEIAQIAGIKDKRVMKFIHNGLKVTAKYGTYLSIKMPALMKVAPEIVEKFSQDYAIAHCLIREEEAPDKIKPLWFRTATDIAGYTGRNAIEPLGVKEKVNALIVDNRRQTIKNIQTNIYKNEKPKELEGRNNGD